MVVKNKKIKNLFTKICKCIAEVSGGGQVKKMQHSSYL